MVIVAGAPFQVSDILGAYPPNGVEATVLNIMANSAETYRFDTLAQLEFELSLRREIVAAAKALNRSGLRFATFHNSECNERYWERTGNGGFRLKRDAIPSAAIRDIFQNGRKYATECATAMVIVYYGALLEVYREETFNRLFPTIYLMNWHELAPLLKETGVPKKVADILPGDRCYFKNPDVNPATPELQGENVIVLLDGLYYGHGIGITNAEQIIRILNANRKEGATRSAFFMENMAARPNFKKLEAAAQSPAAQPSVLRWPPFPRPIRG